MSQIFVDMFENEQAYASSGDSYGTCNCNCDGCYGCNCNCNCVCYCDSGCDDDAGCYC